MTDIEQRARFEAWRKTLMARPNLMRDGEYYEDYDTQIAWSGYQAALASQDVDLGPGIEAAAKLIQKMADDYAEQFGYNDMGVLSFGSGHHAEVKSDHHLFMLELVDELRALIDSQQHQQKEGGNGY